MHKVIVENVCGCFKRSDLKNYMEIPVKDEALSTAIKMKNQMNQEFCRKHEFQLVEDSNNFVISFRPQEASSCCGTGCCS
ncbi:hypothetical protein [Arcobacter sp. LA11]|uniref:hypothetical protein n=1 Tax=Arcobacter sp. LA11 TaxID=1898176 RepID=UPI0009326EC3|nr:hypothetical protein [Arcobacter sp. LA11]